jgi:hypothetical protein
MPLPNPILKKEKERARKRAKELKDKAKVIRGDGAKADYAGEADLWEKHADECERMGG